MELFLLLLLQDLIGLVRELEETVVAQLEDLMEWSVHLELLCNLNSKGKREVECLQTQVDLSKVCLTALLLPVSLPTTKVLQLQGFPTLLRLHLSLRNRIRTRRTGLLQLLPIRS